MARLLTVPLANNEDIVSYECNFASKIVRVLVGIGSLDENNNFIPLPDQTYRTYMITGSDFDALLAAGSSKPAGVFRPDDLWPFIDIKVAAEVSKAPKAEKVK